MNTRRILATKSGWLIPVEILRETPKAYITKDFEGKERRVKKDSSHERLFNGTDAASDWIMGAT